VLKIVERQNPLSIFSCLQKKKLEFKFKSMKLCGFNGLVVAFRVRNPHNPNVYNGMCPFLKIINMLSNLNISWLFFKIIKLMRFLIFKLINFFKKFKFNWTTSIMKCAFLLRNRIFNGFLIFKLFQCYSYSKEKGFNLRFD
jgi:hypothetical protein